MRRTLVRTLFSGVVIVAAANSEVSAQRVGLGFVLGSTDAYKFDTAMGFAPYYQFGSTPLRIHGQFLRRSHVSLDQVCTGDVPTPGGCPIESARARTNSLSLGASWAFSLLNRGAWQIAFPVDLTAVRVAGTREGLTTGRELDADGYYAEVGLGPELGWTPPFAQSLSFRVRGARRATVLAFSGMCADCYEPYQENFKSWVGWFGIEYLLRR